MILKNVRLFDGTGKLWPDAMIRLEGNRIASVEEGAPPTPAAGEKVLDLAGKTVLPGLINCHTHICLDGKWDPHESWRSRSITKNVLLAAQHAERALRAGVTACRDLGGMGEMKVDVGLRDAINEGLILGPRMKVGVRFICMTGGHGWTHGGLEADGPDEVRKATREQIKAGADVIKIMATGGVGTPGLEAGSQQLTYEEMRAAIEEAEKASKLTAAHAQGINGSKAVVRAGVGSIEHGTYLDDEVIDMMLERGTYLVPTLCCGVYIIQGGREAGFPEFMVEKAKRGRDAHLASFERAWKAGVPIATGNDGGPLRTVGDLPDELEQLVANGFTPEQALLAATQVASRVLRMEDQIGTIEAGKLADLVVLRADPLADISNVHKVEMVIKDGQIV